VGKKVKRKGGHGYSDAGEKRIDKRVKKTNKRGGAVGIRRSKYRKEGGRVSTKVNGKEKNRNQARRGNHPSGQPCPPSEMLQANTRIGESSGSIKKRTNEHKAASV